VPEVIEIFRDAVAALREARRALESALDRILATQPLDRAGLQELKVLTARHAGMAMQLRGLIVQGAMHSSLRAEAEQLTKYFDGAETAIAGRLGKADRWR
jgi:hypothetical protein